MSKNISFNEVINNADDYGLVDEGLAFNPAVNQELTRSDSNRVEIIGAGVDIPLEHVLMDNVKIESVKPDTGFRDVPPEELYGQLHDVTNNTNQMLNPRNQMQGPLGDDILNNMFIYGVDTGPEFVIDASQQTINNNVSFTPPSEDNFDFLNPSLDCIQHPNMDTAENNQKQNMDTNAQNRIIDGEEVFVEQGYDNLDINNMLESSIDHTDSGVMVYQPALFDVKYANQNIAQTSKKAEYSVLPEFIHAHKVIVGEHEVTLRKPVLSCDSFDIKDRDEFVIRHLIMSNHQKCENDQFKFDEDYITSIMTNPLTRLVIVDGEYVAYVSFNDYKNGLSADMHGLIRNYEINEDQTITYNTKYFKQFKKLGILDIIIKYYIQNYNIHSINFWVPEYLELKKDHKSIKTSENYQSLPSRLEQDKLLLRPFYKLCVESGFKKQGKIANFVSKNNWRYPVSIYQLDVKKYIETMKQQGQVNSNNSEV
jgi:hypothetical protein